MGRAKRIILSAGIFLESVEMPPRTVAREGEKLLAACSHRRRAQRLEVWPLALPLVDPPHGGVLCGCGIPFAGQRCCSLGCRRTTKQGLLSRDERVSFGCSNELEKVEELSRRDDQHAFVR
jgi:hypothetical protein